jgi:drug/metabolite transporter (DMT)-like permease
MTTGSGGGDFPIAQTPTAKRAFDAEDSDYDDDEYDPVDGLLSVNGKPGRPEDPRKLSPLYSNPESIRHYSASPLQNGRLSPIPTLRVANMPGPNTYCGRASAASRKFWQQNKHVMLVAISQFFGSLMNLTARLLELEGEGMHPLQVLFARQSLTMVCCVAYMYWKGVKDFPFGAREVRYLLVLRGLAGFFGIYGMWYSMMYLPLADATVITFLAPSVAGYICHVVLHEPFTRREQIASYIALAGVVLIARPTSLFSSSSTETAAAATEVPSNMTNTLPGMEHEATTAERLTAIGVGLIGVLGAGITFATIRHIGKRAHPLISVNYFATWSTIVTVTVLTVAPALNIGQPALHFALPSSIRQWVMLTLLGIFGFALQFMMTAGLGGDKSNRANAMIYTHMLFAAGFDRFVFGHVMGWLSLIGCGCIIGSALWVIFSKRPPTQGRESNDLEAAGLRDGESVHMLLHGDSDQNEDDRDVEDDIQLQQIRRGV